MRLKQHFWRNLTRIHKWAGAIIGIQIVIWFASGFFMTFFKIETVRGEHLVQKSGFEIAVDGIIPVEQAIQEYGNDAVYSANLISAVGLPVWQLDGPTGRLYIDGQTGKQWQGLNAAQAREAAGKYYIGEGDINTVTLLDESLSEYRGGSLPVWQLKYDDSARTRLYISPQTGKVLKTRTRLWRAFDFMWMLHVMGYPDRDNTNSWWIILASFSALLFSLSGMALVIHRLILRPRVQKRT